jgi:hypothetical protein
MLCLQAEVPVNWCPALGTVLANEEVIDGLSERGGHPVFRKNLKQVQSQPVPAWKNGRMQRLPTAAGRWRWRRRAPAAD